MRFLVKENKDKSKTILSVNLSDFQYMRVMNIEVQCSSTRCPKMRV